MWILSVFVVFIAVLIFLYSPKVEIHPTALVFDETKVKSLDNVKRVKWDNAKLLFQGQLFGPESITHDPVTGDIFTGTADGLLWKINKELTEAEIILRTGEDHPECGSPKYSHICGRILGLKYVTASKLIVADAHFGILAIDAHSKSKEVLVQPDTNPMTESLKLFNSVDVSDDGIVYFTVSSMKWYLPDFIYSYIEVDSTGRVYSYNLNTKNLKLLASNISFANGIVITHDKKSVLVCELTKRRILKININEPNDISIFVDNLPGPPDNVKIGSDGSYWVSLPATEISSMESFVSAYPCLKTWLVWLLPKTLLTECFKFNSMALQLNDDGQIIKAINGDNKNVMFITEAYEANGHIFLGSIFNKHLIVFTEE